MAVVREDVVRIGFDVEDSALTDLMKMLNDVKKTLSGGIGDDAFDEMVKESKKANDSLDDLKDTVNGIKPDGIQKTAKGLKDTDNKAEDAHRELKKIDKLNFSNTTSGANRLASAMGTVATKTALAATKATALAAAGVAAMAKQSVTGYADYEQLVGGVDTIFKDSSGTVQKYADEAFRTAGLSQNEYMDTVTSFSASLIQSLGGNTGAAAEKANQAIIDMSDNANKLGTDMSSLQYAYQGFAKQNYTMLDNLKLGYGGTKEEMQRLLKDAQKLTGKKYNISSYADIIDAIHAIQVNMDITGTTAKEAEQTITGSGRAAKAAWSNMMTALVLGGDDFDRCLENLVTTTKTFMKNLVPALTKSLGGIGDLIEEVAPILEAEFPALVEALLPPLIKAAASLVRGLITALPTIVSTLAKEVPVILSEVWKAVEDVFGDRFSSIKKVGEFFGYIGEFCMDNQGVIKRLIPLLGGLFVGMKTLKKFGGFNSLFNLFSKSGGAEGGKTGSTFNVKSVLTTMGGIATAIGGIAGIVAAFAALSQIDGYTEFMADGGAALKQLCGIIADIGLVGAAFVGFVAIVGKTTSFKDSVTGMADIAVAMLGMEAVILAFGAIASVECYTDFATGGGDAMSQLCDIIADVALVGAAFVGFVAIVGKTTTIGQAVTGIADIAVAMLGMEAIVAAFGALASIDGYTEFMNRGGDALKQLCSIIEEIGLVGGAFTAFAALIGLVPTSVVLTGLADIALALGGFALVVEAFGLLTAIPGFTDFMQKGGEVLTTLCGILGEMVGSVIGGFAEGVTNGLPGIGTNISTFATNISGALTTFNSIDSKGLSDFASAFGAFALVMTGDALLTFITGGTNYAFLGIKLSTFGTTVAGFFESISKIEKDAFTKATELFDCLAGVKGLPKEGGIVSWFTGDIAYDSIADGLGKLSSEKMVTALNTISGISTTAFTSLTAYLNALADVKDLPKEGGVFQWFTGNIAYDNLASGLTMLTGATVVSAFTTLSTIPAAAFTNLTWLFNALAGITAVPSEGGVFGWFTGSESSGLSAITTQLPGVATDIATFFTNLGNITDFTLIKTLFDTLGQIEVSSDATKGTGFLGLGDSKLATVGQNLSDFATNAAPFFTAVNTLNTGNLTSFFISLSTVGGLPTALANVNASTGTALGTLYTTFSNKLGEIVTLLNNTATTMGNMGTTFSNKLAIVNTSTSTALGTLKTTFANKLGEIIKLMNDTATAAYSSGVSIASGVINGMNSKRGALISTARSLANSVKSAFNVQLDINSPSRVMEASGEDTGMGAINGLRNMIPDAKSAALDFATAATPFGSYTPEGSTTTYNNSTSSEFMNVSPVFNLNITGSQDDYLLARKVKRYVSQAITESFESLERKT